MQIGSFDLKVRRSAATDGARAQPTAGFPQVFGSPFVSTQSMDGGDWAAPAPNPQDAPSQSTDEEDEDESTVFVESHKVGAARA